MGAYSNSSYSADEVERVHPVECDIPDCPFPAYKTIDVPGGCIALPGVERQSLCLQHLNSCQPLIEDYEIVRVSGRATCPDCGEEYRDHPWDEVNVSGINGEPYLHISCVPGERLHT